MTRDQAIDAYRRVRVWNQRQSNAISARVRAVFGDFCCMHNALVSAEQGKPWRELPANYPALARRFMWEQDQVWATSRRLEDAFARYF